MIKKIIEMYKWVEEDGYGRCRPAANTIEKAIILLASASRKVEIPEGHATTDAEGSIRVEWIRDEMCVHLVIPDNKEQSPYIYWEINGFDYGTVDADGEMLIYWLRELWKRLR